MPLESSLFRQDAKLVQIADAALADAARRAGEHLVCHPGCTQCCYGAFAINLLDAIRLRSAMNEMRAVNPAQAAAIAERARLYLGEFGPGFPGDADTGILGSSEEEQAAFEDFANDAPCPALDPETGLCGVYDARPMACRTFGPPVRIGNDAPTGEPGAEPAFAVCELCFTEATPEEIAAAEMIVPHEAEQLLLQKLAQSSQPAGETIVAFCLI